MLGFMLVGYCMNDTLEGGNNDYTEISRSGFGGFVYPVIVGLHFGGAI